jgi:murein DD-endopeptidase MepM/ murein hydrolase activator NlpD
MSTDRSRAAPRLVLLLILLLAALTGGQMPVAATDPDVNDAIAEQEAIEAELARQRSQLADLLRDQADLGASLLSIAADLDAVGLEIEQAVRRLDLLTRSLGQARTDLRRYRSQIVSLERDLDKVAADIRRKQVELRAREALLQDHLRVAYEQSQTSILEVLLSTDSLSVASSELSYLFTLSEEDMRLADEIRNIRSGLQLRRQTLREGRETMSALRDAAADRAATLDRQQRELDALRRQLEDKQGQLEELRATQEGELALVEQHLLAGRLSIEAQERALDQQRELVERLTEAARELDVAYRGRFDWPERGDFMVTQEFGRTSYSYFHTGIDVSYHVPACGGPIYAAGDGVVLADGRPNGMYGDYAIGVVIGHSQRLQTWYWHLSSEIVSVGQEVAVGEIIGYEGATGWATGCHLHFQVLLDGSVMNPRQYLP